MEIDYTISINYGDEGPGESEASPTVDDMVKWIEQGMARDGFASVNVTCKRQ